MTSEHTPTSGNPPHASDTGNPAAPSPDTDSMALSVTRHAPITGPDDWRFLACGIDSLDVGLFVAWDGRWPELLAELEQRKYEAAGTAGIRWRDTSAGPALVLPSGKPPMYRVAIQTADFLAYLGKSAAPKGQTPNAYVSLGSHALWRQTPKGALARLVALLEELGGTVERIQVSRCDLAADFLIPGGLSFDFLRRHVVAKASKTRPELDGDTLETFYRGERDSAIQLR